MDTTESMSNTRLIINVLGFEESVDILRPEKELVAEPYAAIHERLNDLLSEVKRRGLEDELKILRSLRNCYKKRV